MVIALQIVFAMAFVISIGMSIAGVVVAIRTKGLPYKPLWIVGSLFGFAGFSINWTQPDDLYLAFGISIPIFSIWTNGSGEILAKAMFPFGAAATIWKADDIALTQSRTVDRRPDDGLDPQ